MLDYTSSNERLVLREVEGGRILVQGMRTQAVRSVENVVDNLEIAKWKRSKDVSENNLDPSLGHTLIVFQFKKLDGQVASLVFVDVAGSEHQNAP